MKFIIEKKKSDFTFKICIERIIRRLQNMKKSKCIVCGDKLKFYWESRYNGFRGRCVICDTTWPES